MSPHRHSVHRGCSRCQFRNLRRRNAISPACFPAAEHTWKDKSSLMQRWDEWRHCVRMCTDRREGQRGPATGSVQHKGGLSAAAVAKMYPADIQLWFPTFSSNVPPQSASSSMPPMLYCTRLNWFYTRSGQLWSRSTCQSFIYSTCYSIKQWCHSFLFNHHI